MIRFSKEHQWMKLADDGTAYVGITQFAADELGEISFIEMPEVGKAYAKDEQLCVVESVKAASDVFMPAACTVTEVNSMLETNPAPLNDSPEGDGWICKVSGVDKAQFDALMDADAYKEFVK